MTEVLFQFVLSSTKEEVHKDGDHEDMDARLQEAWDDVSGAPQDPKEVRRARLKEIQYIKDKKVWRKIPRQEALRRGYKIVKGRWIDVNEGDSTNWKYRSRYVAKEFNTGDEDGQFASNHHQKPWDSSSAMRPRGKRRRTRLLW